MPSSLDQLEQKLESAKAKLLRLQKRAFTLKKRVWQRQDDRTLKRLKAQVKKTVSYKTP